MPPPHRNVLSVVRRILIDHVLLVTAAAVLVLSRDPDTHQHVPSLAVDKLSLPSFPGRFLVGEGLLTIAFGVSLIVGIDLGFTLLSLVALVGQTTLHALAPSAVPAFDLRTWPPMFDSPHLSTSVQELWAKRWHAQFSPTFRFLGYDPAAALTRSIGIGKTGQRAVGALAVFILSGLFHEFGTHRPSFTEKTS